MTEKGKWRIPAAVFLAFVVLVSAAPVVHANHDEIVDKVSKGTTDLVSISTDGRQGNGDSGSAGTDPSACRPAFGRFGASDDGRRVVFESTAGNLHPSDVNGKMLTDIFVFDRTRGKMDLVSAMPHGLAGDAPSVTQGLCPQRSVLSSSNPSISGNGRYVVFESHLPLTGTDQPEAAIPGSKVFLRDLKKRTTELVSLSSDGLPVFTDAIFNWGFPDVSDDGRYVAFSSRAPGVTKEECAAATGIPLLDDNVPGLCGFQVYVRDRKKGETFLASRSNSGDPADKEIETAFISGNGRYVAYSTAATNLLDTPMAPCLPFDVARPVHPCHNVFVHDLRTRKTELISASRDGSPANHSRLVIRSGGYKPQIMSDDGRFMLFFSDSTEIVPGNPPFPGGSYAYLRDRGTGRTQRVSVSSSGRILQSAGAHRFSISDDGRHVLVPMSVQIGCIGSLCDGKHDTSGGFIVDRTTGQTDRVTWAAGPKGPPGATEGHFAQLGGDGSFLVQAALDEQALVDGDANGFMDVFVRDIERRPLGIDGVGKKAAPQREAPEEDDSLICLEDVCIPPQGALVTRARGNEDGVSTRPGAELYGASLAYRPALDDLFAAIELEHMGPALTIGPGGSLTGGLPSLLFGLRFDVEDKSYEVRATSLLAGTFGLFDCTYLMPNCLNVTNLRGGYGTTGERVVFSLPLDAIGLERGGKLKDVEAFSGFGSFMTGATSILDTVRLK